MRMVKKESHIIRMWRMKMDLTDEEDCDPSASLSLSLSLSLVCLLLLFLSLTCPPFSRPVHNFVLYAWFIAFAESKSIVKI